MNNTFQMRSFLRFLERNKLYTAINMFGFAVSLMFVVLLTVYIQKESTVDDYHLNKERIYRLQHSGGTYYSAAVPPILESRLPEVEAVTRFFPYQMKAQVSGGEHERFMTDGCLVDSAFFTMFSWPFVEGDPTTVMHTKSDVVLSQSFARKLFGNEPAMGETVEINGSNFVVSGVIRDIEDSHFRPADIFMPFVNLGDFWSNQTVLTEFDNNSFAIYVMSRPGSDLPAKAADLEAHFRELDYWLFTQNRVDQVEFAPLQGLYYSKAPTTGGTRTNDRTFLLILAATALVILVFAVINYINLSVAQTGFRAGEAAMRRLLGGSRRQLIVGLITESILLCALSLVIALGLASLVEPFFQQMFATDMMLEEGLTGQNIGLMVAGIVVLGVISGLIPALTITGFMPIDVVRGTFRRHTKMVFSKVLIAFQYAITIVLIGCTITIVRQVDYMTRGDVGFRTAHILVVSNFSVSESGSFGDALLAIPGVEQVSYARGVPLLNQNNNSFTDNNGVNHSFTVYIADTAYFSMLGFEVLGSSGNERADAVWINETAWRQLGLADDATEYTGAGEQWRFNLRGKVRDFHTHDFLTSVGEVAIWPLTNKDWATHLLIKVSPADPFGTMEQVRELYNERVGGNLFQGEFLDRSVAQLYEKQTRMSQILGSLSLLAIVISTLGMLAMSTYFVRQRAQEVAVRKVFGARIGEVLGMLMMSFLKLLGIAFVVAVPAIWLLMREWLSGYAYRIELDWIIFAASGAIAFAIAAATVLWQSLLAAHTNPIVSIRD